MILPCWKVILWSNPPPFWNFLGLWPPHPPGISNSLRGGGLDIFWNHTFDVLSGIPPDEDLQYAVKTYDQYPSDFNETNNKTKFFININHNEKYLSWQVS